VTGVRHVGKETVAEDEFSEFADPDQELTVHREPLILEGKSQKLRRLTKAAPSLIEKLRHAPLRTMARMTGISCDALSRYRRGTVAPDPTRAARILTALDDLGRAALAENCEARCAAQLRDRIKSLSPGATEISGVTRVMKTVEAHISRASLSGFIFRAQVLTPHELDVIMATVVRLEEEDFPVGPASICGTITRVRHVDRETGFAVFDVLPDGSELSIVVRGVSSRYLGRGMLAGVEGAWEYHEEFGQQVGAQRIMLGLPRKEEDIRTYLASGPIPGIGRVLAGRLVRHFGKRVFCVAEDQPDELVAVKGMTQKSIGALRAAVGE
jgi:hypothetical protein